MNRMREGGIFFGATPEAFSAIESAFEELLDLLDQHFLEVPYLMGGKPSIGDFGLIAPFYGHLGRDPYPAMMMKKRAPRVFRWTERMNRSESDMGEFPDQAEGFIENDDIPDTLKAVLHHIGEDLMPETKAAGACIDQWLEEFTPPPGSPVERGVRFGKFDFRGVKIQAIAQPYRFLLLARMQQAFAGLTDEDQEDVKALLKDLGLDELLSITLSREVRRHDHLEVWG